MKLMRKALLAVLLAVFSILTIAACGETEVQVERLPAPENLRIRERKLLWGRVENAVGYSVEIDGEVIDLNAYFYDVSDLTPLVEHTLRVKAKSDPNGSVEDSEWAKLSYTPEELPAEGLKFTLRGKEYTVAKGGGELSGRVVIPRKNDVYPVTKIRSYAFSGCSEITELVLPDTIVSIGEAAFIGCENLETINIPESVTSIDSRAFEGCKSLKSVTLPETIVTISESLFFGCESLESFTVPNSVTKIGDFAFRGCVKLNELKLPNERIDFTQDAFFDTAIWNNQPDGPVYLGNILLGCKGDWLMGDIVINDIAPGTTTIARRAFAGILSLTKLRMPDSVTYIGESAFEKSGLCEVVLSNNLEKIEKATFKQTHLKRIEIPGSVKTIGAEAFSGIEALTEVVFSEGLVSIGEGAFAECLGLTRLELPNSLEIIGRRAFYGGLKNLLRPALESVKFGAALKTIGEEAFYSCTQLRTIEYAGTAEQWTAVNKLSKWDYNGRFDVFEGKIIETRREYTVICSDKEIKVENPA